MTRVAVADKTVLGATVEDLVTKFRGVATGYVSYVTGCNQVLVSPPLDKEGKVQVSEWFDEQRLVIDESVPQHRFNNEAPGCDRPAPKR